MKTQILLLVLVTRFLITGAAFSQNIAINATGSLPDTSAMLDVSSVTKGFLAPRMTTAQQNAIPLPANGLLVFNTTTNAFQVNTGTTSSPVWTMLVPSGRTINTNFPLTGGGDFTADRTLSMDTTSSNGVATKYNLLSLISKGSLSASAPLMYNNSTGLFSADTSSGATQLATQGFVTRQGYITGNQTISFAPTGDVTGSTTGTTTLAPALSIGAGKVTNTMIANGTIDLTAKVTGILPVANGGTNSNAALNNNRVMKSSGGTIIEAAAITANRALISDVNGIPTHSTVTNTELGYVSGVTSAIQTQLNAKQSTTLTNTHILVGNAGNVATDVAASGDITLANTGAFTIANNAITTAKILDANVTNAKLANSTISGISLGSNLNTLTLGYGLTGTSYNGSGVVTAKVDTSTLTTNPATQGFVSRGTWSTTGNSSTNASKYLGTTDLVSLRIRTNNTERMVVDSLGKVGIGTLSPGSTLDVKGSLRLSGATSGYVGFAPAAAAGSTTYTLPAADGTNGEALMTDGTGNLSWGSPTTIHLVGSSSNVTFTKGAGAGASPTIVVTGNDIGGKISVTTGNGPNASAPIVTVNFISPFASPVYVTFSPGNANAANLTSGIGKEVYISGTSTTDFVLAAPTTALSGPGIVYIWYYTVTN